MPAPARRFKTAIFTSLFKLIWPVQPLDQKYFCLRKSEIMISCSRPAATRGALRDRHERWMRDAMDAAARARRTRAAADGEAVWS
jgi:hypothetical protein